MKFLLRKFLIVFVILAGLSFGFVGQAADSDQTEDQYVTDINYTLEQPLSSITTITNLGQYINLVYRYALGLVGIIATVLIMAGGVMWLTSAGNEQSITQGKELITSAVIGLVLALFSYSILYLINPNFVNMKLAVLKIPVPAELANPDNACVNDKPLIEKTGLKTCSGGSTIPLPSGAKTSYSSTDLNKWITKYVKAFNSGLSLTMMKAIVKHESGYCINAHNPDPKSNACGLMGTLPGYLWNSRKEQNISDNNQIIAVCADKAGLAYNQSNGTDWQSICNFMATNPEVGVCAGVKIFADFSKGLNSTDSRTILGAYHCGWNIWKSSINCGAGVASYYCPADYPERCHSENPKLSGDQFLKMRDDICQDNQLCRPVNTAEGAIEVAINGYCTSEAETDEADMGTADKDTVYSYAICGGSNIVCPTVADFTLMFKDTGPCMYDTPSADDIPFWDFSSVKNYGGVSNLYTSKPKCKDAM
ncbi:MAG: pilin [Patescibacteria group bacterium]|jgi:hypothetical protein